MGFRIIVYNNIITKFYTFQAERERVLLKSCTILISTHNWGRRRRRGGGKVANMFAMTLSLTDEATARLQILSFNI